MTYEQYKNSGIDWIGQIPEHWEVKRLQDHFNLINGFPFESKLFSLEKGFPLVRIRDIIDQQIETYYLGKIEKSALINNGDILIGMDGDFNTRIWQNGEALLNQRVCCIRSKGVSLSKFLFYQLGKPLKKINDLTYATTVKHLSSFDVLKLKIAIPPIHEQEAIANFLDDKTAKIDALVQTKEQQIEKLKELRQAKIHHAVTKGLPLGFDSAQPTYGVEMKDSGIEWIGEIPKHWEVRRLSTLGKFSKGGGFSKADLVEEYGVSAILYGDIYTKYNYIINESVRLISNIAASNAIVIEYDDLLFTGSGETKEDIGKCVAFKSKTLTVAGGDIIIFKQFTNSSNYLSYCLNTEGAKFEKAKSSKGEIIVHTYASKLKEIVVPIPPIQEQEQIVAYLDEVTAKIDQAIAQKQEQITKLKEYKQSLINEVVTGKVKVC